MSERIVPVYPFESERNKIKVSPGENVILEVQIAGFEKLYDQPGSFVDFGLYATSDTNSGMDPDRLPQGGVDMVALSPSDYRVDDRFAAGTNPEVHLYTASRRVLVHTQGDVGGFAAVPKWYPAALVARMVRSNRQTPT